MSNEYRDWLHDEVLNFAIQKHDGQVRKYTNEPYIFHPISVAKIIADVCQYLQDNHKRYVYTTELYYLQEVAYLHDVLEDTETSWDELNHKFGERLSEDVKWLTNTTTLADGNRETRKKIELERLLQAPIIPTIVKLADIIDNCSNIVERDKDFAKKYLKEKMYYLNEVNKKYDGILGQETQDLIYKELYKRAKSLLTEELKKI